ncbi:hypothetical protein Tco_0064228 [Tanacetum coccineum]
MRDSSDKHFLRFETWKVLWILLSFSGSSSLYATGPIPFQGIWIGLMYWDYASSFSELKDTFTSLQALTNLYDLFNGFLNYFWSRSAILPTSGQK